MYNEFYFWKTYYAQPMSNHNKHRSLIPIQSLRIQATLDKAEIHKLPHRVPSRFLALSNDLLFSSPVHSWMSSSNLFFYRLRTRWTTPCMIVGIGKITNMKNNTPIQSFIQHTKYGHANTRIHNVFTHLLIKHNKKSKQKTIHDTHFIQQSSTFKVRFSSWLDFGSY